MIGGNVHNPREINELISRNKDEIVRFEEMDEELLRTGAKPRGLMTEDEVPSWVLQGDEEDDAQVNAWNKTKHA